MDKAVQAKTATCRSRLRRFPLPKMKPTEAYNYRSNFVHGQVLQGQNISKKVQDRYVHLETLLRLMVKQCIGDPQFASRFETETAINAGLPDLS